MYAVIGAEEAMRLADATSVASYAPLHASSSAMPVATASKGNHATRPFSHPYCSVCLSEATCACVRAWLYTRTSSIVPENPEFAAVPLPMRSVSSSTSPAANSDDFDTAPSTMSPTTLPSYDAETWCHSPSLMILLLMTCAFWSDSDADSDVPPYTRDSIVKLNAPLKPATLTTSS